MEKVYCKNCKYFQETYHCISYGWTPQCGKVKAIELEDKPEGIIKKKVKYNMNVENKNNNCKHFKPKFLYILKIFFLDGGSKYTITR